MVGICMRPGLCFGMGVYSGGSSGSGFMFRVYPVLICGVMCFERLVFMFWMMF